MYKGFLVEQRLYHWSLYPSKPGIPDMQHCVALCFIFKLCEFMPLEHYFKFGFRGAANETHLNLPSFIKCCVKLTNSA